MGKSYKTTKTTMSVGFAINEPKISEAKDYLKKEFGSKYDANPHFNFVIIAMPEHQLKDAEKALDGYFENEPAIKLKLGNLHFEPKDRFYSIPIVGDEVMQVHKELLDLLNSVRDSYIRKKDLIRIQEGRADQKETEYISKYGYLRVLNKFMPHITIGNVNVESDAVKDKLDGILNVIYGKELTVNKVIVSFFEDADKQSDYRFIWEKEVPLLG